MAKVVLKTLIVFILTVFIPALTIASNLVSDDEVVYDTVNDITWLKDGHYIYNSGYSKNNNRCTNNGNVTWRCASEWAEDLTFAGGSDWRLPELETGQEGTIDGELGDLFYNQLGFEEGQSDYSNEHFNNLQSFGYWTDNRSSSTRLAWAFNFQTGKNTQLPDTAGRAVILVHDGDLNVLGTYATWQSNRVFWQEQNVTW